MGLLQHPHKHRGHGYVVCWDMCRPALVVILWMSIAGCWIQIHATPGQEMFELDQSVSLEWRESRIGANRSQDGFYCLSNQKCKILNLTSHCPIYICPKCVKNQYNVPAVEKGCMVNLTANVTICVAKATNDSLKCDTTLNGTKLSINIRGDKEVYLMNGTVINGRQIPFVYPIVVVDKNPKHISPTNLAPILSTCTTVATQTSHITVNWMVRIPPIPKCSTKKKRAWYDTLLGGFGTVLGISNTINNEVTRSMLADTGHQTSLGIQQVGFWMPTVVGPQMEAANLFQKRLNRDLTMWNATSELMTNITRAFNWTVCNMQVLDIRTQLERFTRIVTTNHARQWREVWNITEEWWLIPHPEKTICNSTMCSGQWTQLNVTEAVDVCKYHVLPVITATAFWFIQLKGGWFAPGQNNTYDLSECDLTDQGYACLSRAIYTEPCLTMTEALCEWRIEKPRDIMWQIGPHTICVATLNSHPMLPRIPFTGCLHGVHMWRWHNRTYHLTNFSSEAHLTALQWRVLEVPWQVSLDRLRGALSGSTEIEQLIGDHMFNVRAAVISTVVAQGKVLHAAHQIEQVSAHHWWDIFSGMSVTARNTLVPPLAILVAVLCILTLCNFSAFCYIRRVKQVLSKRMYKSLAI